MYVCSSETRSWSHYWMNIFYKVALHDEDFVFDNEIDEVCYFWKEEIGDVHKNRNSEIFVQFLLENWHIIEDA